MVQLSDGLKQVLEQLAENVHDTWAAQRLADGWRWGPERNDQKQEHPMLIPYQELPESEKEYDRATAKATLKVLLKLGCRILLPAESDAAPSHTEIQAQLTQLEQSSRHPGGLLRAWRQRQKRIWSGSVEVYRLCAESLCKQGEALTACDCCREGLEHFPADLRLQQLLGWALAQSGATESARELLSVLPHDCEQACESLCLLGRTWKDLARMQGDPAARAKMLTTAAECYARGYESSQRSGAPEYYPAINCAALHVLLDQMDSAREWAGTAAKLADRESPKEAWAKATLGEASLILGRMDEAKTHYASFVSALGNNPGMLASARKQALAIADHLQTGRSIVEGVLPMPPILIPGPDTDPGTPATALVFCPLDRNQANRMEQFMQQKVPIHLLLPIPLEHFGPAQLGLSQTSMMRWTEYCSSITVASPKGDQVSEETLRYCALLTVGIAKFMAHLFATVPVHDASNPLPDGQTGTFQKRVEEILQSPGNPGLSLPTLIFADVVGYGQLTDSQVVSFQTQFLPELARFLGSFPDQPLTAQTWGDALYLAFEELRSGGMAALRLQRFFSNTDWKSFGIPHPLRLRLGIHTGPVTLVRDPFTDQTLCTGIHVSRAARIEPLAEAGQVFASTAFAASALATGLRDFEFRFVGTHQLPKDAGSEGLFQVSSSI